MWLALLNHHFKSGEWCDILPIWNLKTNADEIRIILAVN